MGEAARSGPGLGRRAQSTAGALKQL